MSNNRLVFPQGLLIDAFLIFPFWILILIAIQSILFFVLVDLLGLILKILKRNIKEQITKYSSFITLIIIVFFSIYIPIRILYDYNTIEVSNYNYTKKDLPKNLDGFKIVFISDMQVDRYTNENRVGKLISLVNKQDPELVLIGGDFITSTPEYINEAATFAGQIISKYGVYSCVGDHDNWAYRWDTKRSLLEVEAALKENNIKMIDNGSITLPVDSSSIRITFVTNTYVQKISQVVLDSVVDKENRYDLKIFLTHQPRQFLIDKAKKFNYNLYLAGHTHGGQIMFLFPFKNLSPTMLETKYVRGVFNFGKLTVMVTRGLGMSIAPVRYNSTPEITVITLSK
ncbi:MAG: metallophosphoesterase [Bacteroidetes bacterium]|nr:metallophosphoesterase [Bacteroidota bacterium]